MVGEHFESYLLQMARLDILMIENSEGRNDF